MFDGEDPANVYIPRLVPFVVCACRTENAHNCVYVLYVQEGQLLIFRQLSMYLFRLGVLESYPA